MGTGVRIVDSALSTAVEVRKELGLNGLLNESPGKVAKLFASDVSSGFALMAERFFGKGLPEVQKVEFEVADFWV